MLQVMVWRTNFDRHLDDFVLSHIERGETQLKHETEIFPKPASASTPKDQPAQPPSMPSTGAAVPGTGALNGVAGAPPDGHSSRPSAAVRTSGARSTILFEKYLSPEVRGPTVLGCMQSEVAVQRTQPAEYELEMPAPLALTELQPALANTLQHIVGKLDMMTQVIGMVEERLCLNEDKMANLEASLQQLAATVAVPVAHTTPAAPASAIPAIPPEEGGGHNHDP